MERYYEPIYEPNPRSTIHHIRDPRTGNIRFVKRFTRERQLEPYVFCGNPEDYSSWENCLERYFEDKYMSEERRFRFAKPLLRDQASRDWREIESKYRFSEEAEFYNERYITTWRVMKSKLREIYLPQSHDPRSYETPTSPYHRTAPPQTYPSQSEPRRSSLRQSSSSQTGIPRYQSSPSPLSQPQSYRTYTPEYESYASLSSIRQTEPFRTSALRSESYPSFSSLSQPQPLRTSIPRHEPCPDPILPNPLEPTRISVHEQSPGIIPTSYIQANLTQTEIMLEEKVEKAYESTIEEEAEIYEPSQELVDAYEEEEIECEEKEQGDERNKSVKEYLEIGVNLEEAEFNNELKEVDFEPIEVSKEVITKDPQDLIYEEAQEVEPSESLEGVDPEPTDEPEEEIKPGSDSYFLPFPDTSHVARTTRLHFLEVSQLHAFTIHVLFASYLWKTLWHLLGTHAKFSSACLPPAKSQTVVVV